MECQLKLAGLSFFYFHIFESFFRAANSDGIQGSPGSVKRSGTQHRGLGNRRAKSQGRNDYQCFLHNWGRLNGVNLFRLADYKSEVNTKR